MAVREVKLAQLPEVITVSPGDTILVNSSFNYIGPPVDLDLYTAIWKKGLIDPHVPIASGKRAFSIPETVPPPGMNYTFGVEMEVPLGEGGFFGLFTRISSIPGPDIFSPYYENLIEIVGAVPAFSNLEIVSYAKV